jgi:PTH1 family peptidyl-tRNA hydrolase
VAPPRIVLGLGNPGSRYRSTRHNLGFRVVDRIAESRGVRWVEANSPSRTAAVAEIHGPDGTFVLARPRTFMNRAGRAGVALCGHYQAGPQDLLVVYDDADLELGRVRIRDSGSAGGHNGLQSLIDALRSDQIPRLRLGVRGSARDEHDLADYVLAPFDPAEEALVVALVELGAAAVDAVLAEGLVAAMNRFNGRLASPPDGVAGPGGRC